MEVEDNDNVELIGSSNINDVFDRIITLLTRYNDY